MSVNAIAAIENRMVRVIQNLHSNRVRVEVLPRTMSAAVPGDRDEEWPKAFNEIQITFHCTWEGDTDKKLVEQAIDWACNRYCPIHATLSRGVKIEHRRKDSH